jgi:molybdopterin converting factor small subunit
MKITLDYSSYLLHQIVRPQSAIELDEPYFVQDLIRRLAEEYGETFRNTILDASGNLRPMILLSVNEEQIDWNEPLPLRNGDRIALLSPIAGG